MIETQEVTVATPANEIPVSPLGPRGRFLMFDDVEVAAALKVSQTTLRNWRKQTQDEGTQVGPKFRKVGRQVRYMGEWVQEFLTGAMA